MTLAVVDDLTNAQNQWILDSGYSRHLVSDERMLEKSSACESE